MKYLVPVIILVGIVGLGLVSISNSIQIHNELVQSIADMQTNEQEWHNSMAEVSQQLSKVAQAYKIMYDSATPEIKKKVDALVPQSAQIGGSTAHTNY